MTNIGVAIAVPGPFGEHLRSRRADFGDRQAEFVPTHVTLIPPTAVGHEHVPQWDQTLARIAGQHQAFAMSLSGTGTFRPVSPVVFVAVSEGIAPTELLAAQLRNELDVGELEFPFHPHVTVAQAIPDQGLDRAFGELSDYGCEFTVEAFTMYVQDGGEAWQEYRSYALG